MKKLSKNQILELVNNPANFSNNKFFIKDDANGKNVFLIPENNYDYVSEKIVENATLAESYITESGTKKLKFIDQDVVGTKSKYNNNILSGIVNIVISEKNIKDDGTIKCSISSSGNSFKFNREIYVYE